MSESNSPRGLSRDIAQIKSGGAATAAELRSFMGQLRGKRPEEVMGTIAGSTLVQCTTLATVATVALMAVFTLGPYLYGKWNPPKAAVAVAATQPAPREQVSAAAPPAPVNAANAVDSVGPATSEAARGSAGLKNPLEPSVADKQKAAERLGVSETKAADPKKNPLENSADDLLKDLK
jgi:hypothetical protein